jgi:hypothetical protein
MVLVAGLVPAGGSGDILPVPVSLQTAFFVNWYTTELSVLGSQLPTG